MLNYCVSIYISLIPHKNSHVETEQEKVIKMSFQNRVLLQSCNNFANQSLSPSNFHLHFHESHKNDYSYHKSVSMMDDFYW